MMIKTQIRAIKNKTKKKRKYKQPAEQNPFFLARQLIVVLMIESVEWIEKKDKREREQRKKDSPKISSPIKELKITSTMRLRLRLLYQLNDLVSIKFSISLSIYLSLSQIYF